jgi:hypothetical protein
MGDMIQMKMIKTTKAIKADLRYGNYCSKLVHFESNINIFYVF